MSPDKAPQKPSFTPPKIDQIKIEKFELRADFTDEISEIVEQANSEERELTEEEKIEITVIDAFPDNMRGRDLLRKHYSEETLTEEEKKELRAILPEKLEGMKLD